MNTLIKRTAFFVAIGTAAFLLHANSVPDAPSGDVRDADSQALAVIDSTSSATTAEEFSLVSPEQVPHYADEPVGFASSYLDETLATPALRQTQEPVRESVEEKADKQRIARSKMSGPVAALAMAGGATPTEIIVSYANHPELAEDDLIASLGGEVVRHYEIFQLLAIRIPAGSLIDLAVEDNVEHLSLDDVVHASSTVSKTAASFPVYPSGNAAYDAHDIRVAMLDSGVAEHDDLDHSVIQFSFLNGHFPRPGVDDGEISSAEDLEDEFGHGTHIAGIIAGNGESSSGSYSGPASGASIISLQVLDKNGHGQTSDVMAALEWLMKYGPYLNIRVANLSLGKPITESNTTDPLVRAVEQVWSRGIVVAVAAGNYGREGYFSTTSPGNSRKVITVGSLTDNNTGSDFSDDYTSTYSSKGPTAGDHVIKPDLLAPGNRLIAATPDTSTLATLLPGNQVVCTSSDCDDDYLELSGTSMATGLVSAAAAMMLQKDPTLTPATIKARLMRSARKLGESPIVAGAGLLDIDAAMNESGIVSGEALSPLMAFDAATGGTMVQDTAVLWGDDIWGAGYLWTDGGSVSANGYLWTDGGSVSANGYLWTDGGSVSANGYLWTDGSIWANGYLWTDGGIAAFGYLWTDGGIHAKGYLWTDGDAVDANGYLWTDGGSVRSLGMLDLYSANPSLNDDEPTSD